MLYGEQLRAARALLRWTLKDLSAKASAIEPVSSDALKKWEATDGPIRGINTKIDAVVKVLEAAGVELLNSDAPGARLRKAG
ncbi:hypothetical protein [Azospirillum argentinense]